MAFATASNAPKRRQFFKIVDEAFLEQKQAGEPADRPPERMPQATTQSPSSAYSSDKVALLGVGLAVGVGVGWACRGSGDIVTARSRRRDGWRSVAGEPPAVDWSC
jgi:hypothetical protein